VPQDPDAVDRARRRSGNPAVRAGATDPSAGRAELERRSLPFLVRLAAVPRWALLVAVLALVIAGLLVPGWIGALLLVVVAGLAAWLLAVSWPALTPAGRAVRAALVLLVLADVVFKLVTGR
jgi:hypothetical protein